MLKKAKDFFRGIYEAGLRVSSRPPVGEKAVIDKDKEGRDRKRDRLSLIYGQFCMGLGMMAGSTGALASVFALGAATPLVGPAAALVVAPVVGAAVSLVAIPYGIGVTVGGMRKVAEMQARRGLEGKMRARDFINIAPLSNKKQYRQQVRSRRVDFQKAAKLFRAIRASGRAEEVAAAFTAAEKKKKPGKDGHEVSRPSLPSLQP